MIDLRTKLHMRISSGLLRTAIKQKAEENLCVVAILLFYILQKCCLNENGVFSQNPLS
jgi:hypothetical protein